MIPAHRHHCAIYAGQLLLAELLLDGSARRAILGRIGDCVDCWRQTVDSLVSDRWGDMLRRYGMPSVSDTGLIEGPAIDAACRELIHAIDATGDRKDVA